MEYFAYQPKVSGTIWNIFKDLGTQSPAEIERAYSATEYSHTLEIVSAAMNGSIDLDGPFNLLAYERACQETDAIEQRKIKGPKELNIVDFETTKDTDLQVGYGDISSRSLRSKEDLIDEVVRRQSLNNGLDQLFNIRSRYIVERGVDVVSVLANALRGISDAMASFKGLLEDSTLKELFTNLCEDSQDGELLRQLEARLVAA